MCSRCISLQLLAAVESNSAHAAFSTNRCRSISSSAILTRWKTYICSLRVYNKHRTSHSAPFTFTAVSRMLTLSAGRGRVRLHKHECRSKGNCLLDLTCLSLCVYSTGVRWSGQSSLIQVKICI